MSRRSFRSRHANFAGAFTDGEVFVAPKGWSEDFVIRVEGGGTLVVPSGRIIASEPAQIGWRENQRPFSRRVEPGEYPVLVSVANHWPACLMIRFTECEPVRWEMATRDGEDASRIFEGQLFTYGVDGGTGGFADADAAFQLVSHRDWFANVVPEIDHAAERSARAGRTCFEYVLDRSTGANLVGCPSGHGDGGYASYWGLDAHGQITCLVTDFAVLVEGVSGTACIEHIDSLIGNELEHDGLRRIGLTQVRVVPHEHPRFGFYFEYEGRGTADARLIDINGAVVADTFSGGCRVRGGRHHQKDLRCDPAEVVGGKIVITFSRGCRSLLCRGAG